MDGYARSREGFEKRLGRARKTMIYRAQVRNAQLGESMAEQIVSRLMKQSSRADLLGSLDTSSHDNSSLDGAAPLRKKGSQVALAAAGGEEGERTQGRAGGSATDAPGRTTTRKYKKKISTDTLFAVVIFDEFLRELSALSQEHSALNPLLMLPKASEP